MKVELIKPYGFCFGVKRAITIAKQAKKENSYDKVYILGSLVHNENVQKDLIDLGLIILDDREKSIDAWIKELPDYSIVVFSAHGHAPHIDEIAKEKHMVVYDATCPFVIENMKAIIEEISKGNDVIYIGEKNHAESMATVQINENKVHLMEYGKKFDFVKLNSERPFVISQTTMLPGEVDSCVDAVLESFPNAKIAPGRCYSTKERQEAIAKSPENIDCFVILGSTTSNNTNKLEALARESHPKALIIRALTLQDVKDQISEISKCDHVCIASGASTSDELSEEVLKYLEN